VLKLQFPNAETLVSRYETFGFKPWN